MFPLYHQPLFRPPSEAHSLIFQVTLGCSWNQCTFCEMYTSKNFKPRSFQDIKEEISQAAKLYPQTEKIFLADGDALVLSNNKLVPILKHINACFPKLKRITSYATPKNILTKSDDELKELKKHNLSMIYYGVESGDPVVLEKIKKGATAEEISTGISKARSAGLVVSTTNLLGIGGKSYSRQHAINTAKVLNASEPEFVSFLMVMFPLGENRFREAFGPEYEPLDQHELLIELKTTLEHLEVKNCTIRANHASNYLPIKAHFPQDKQQTIDFIDQVLKDPDSPLLRPEFMRSL